MEKFPVVSPVEEAVSNQVNALIGQHDINFNTIVKMNMLKEMDLVSQPEIQEILSQIAKSNRMEYKFIEQDYAFTMDSGGNLIPINSIDERKEGEKDS